MILSLEFLYLMLISGRNLQNLSSSFAGKVRPVKVTLTVSIFSSLNFGMPQRRGLRPPKDAGRVRTAGPRLGACCAGWGDIQPPLATHLPECDGLILIDVEDLPQPRHPEHLPHVRRRRQQRDPASRPARRQLRRDHLAQPARVDVPDARQVEQEVGAAGGDQAARLPAEVIPPVADRDRALQVEDRHPPDLTLAGGGPARGRERLPDASHRLRLYLQGRVKVVMPAGGRTRRPGKAPFGGQQRYACGPPMSTNRGGPHLLTPRTDVRPVNVFFSGDAARLVMGEAGETFLKFRRERKRRPDSGGPAASRLMIAHKVAFTVLTPANAWAEGFNARAMIDIGTAPRFAV